MAHPAVPAGTKTVLTGRPESEVQRVAAELRQALGIRQADHF